VIARRCSGSQASLDQLIQSCLDQTITFVTVRLVLKIHLAPHHRDDFQAIDTESLGDQCIRREIEGANIATRCDPLEGAVIERFD